VPHTLGFALILALLAALFLFGAVREARLSRGRLALARELSRTGQLAQVQIVETKRDGLGFRVMLRYRYRTPIGTLLEARIPISEGGAFRVDESPQASLALVSHDGKRGLLLTRSGYPLLNPPSALSLPPTR
jgi:hypothetical protein